MQIKNLLQKAGLDQHEVDTYIALISLGEATAGQLSRMSRVPRTYTYNVLESLADKGFVQSDSSRSIRRYSITDFQAAQRYIERKQLELYKVQQEAQTLNAQLENLSNPQAPTAIVNPANDQAGLDEFWKLLHSTITREIWIANAPSWWDDESFSNEVKKWQKFRQKQHIWEKHFTGEEREEEAQRFTEYEVLKNPPKSSSSLFLIDQYQVQITSWSPFRSIRIESQEMVDLQQSMLG